MKTIFRTSISSARSSGYVIKNCHISFICAFKNHCSNKYVRFVFLHLSENAHLEKQNMLGLEYSYSTLDA